jgi:hypothetical protein
MEKGAVFMPGDEAFSGLPEEAPPCHAKTVARKTVKIAAK